MPLAVLALLSCGGVDLDILGGCFQRLQSTALIGIHDCHDIISWKVPIFSYTHATADASEMGRVELQQMDAGEIVRPRYLTVEKSGSTSIEMALDLWAGRTCKVASLCNQESSRLVHMANATFSNSVRLQERADSNHDGSFGAWTNALAFTFVREPMDRLYTQYTWWANRVHAKDREKNVSSLTRDCTDAACKFNAWMRQYWRHLSPSDEAQHIHVSKRDPHFTPQLTFLRCAAREAEATGGQHAKPFSFIGRLTDETTLGDWETFKRLLNSTPGGKDAMHISSLGHARQTIGLWVTINKTHCQHTFQNTRMCGSSMHRRGGLQGLINLFDDDNMQRFCELYRDEYACLGFALPSRCDAIARRGSLHS
jgi:hypothetical protein